MKGKFPLGRIDVNKSILKIRKGPLLSLFTFFVLMLFGKGVGLGRVSETAEKGSKPAQTIFQRVYYDEAEDYSIICCLPVTGRTHQIRVSTQSFLENV